MKALKRESEVLVDILITDKFKTEFTNDFLSVVSKAVFEAAEASFNEAEISVLITDDKEICLLNKEYRQKDYSTDVLSFPMAEYPLEDGGMLGDIVISLETAKKQAAENTIDIKREFAFLYIHGLLHLLGFDHETSPEDEEEMFDLQEAILLKLVEQQFVP